MIVATMLFVGTTRRQMMWILPAVALLCVLAAASPAFRANPHLHVSAEGQGNRFAGSMVV